jgi:peroxiredoxin
VQLEAELYDLLEKRAVFFARRQLDALKREAEAQAPEETRALDYNDTLEDFELPNAVGTPVRLSSLLRAGPVVILVFRGCWSERDRHRVKTLDQLSPQFSRRGMTCTTLSPVVPVRCLFAAERDGISLEMISDVGAIITRRLASTQMVAPSALWGLRRLGVDVPRVYGLERPSLPTPCLAVVDTDARLKFLHSFGPRDARDIQVFTSLIESPC